MVVNKRTWSGPGIYIGRPGPWGNPFVVGKHGARGECIALHREWLWEEIKAGRITLESLAKLHEQTLICWCAPAPCHGNTLEAAAAWAVNELERSKS